MDELPHYYLSLFNAVTDAIALIDEMNFGYAKETLIKGQLWAEELYIAEKEGELTDEKKLETWMRAGAKRAKAQEKKPCPEIGDTLEMDRKVKALMKAAGETTQRKRAD